MKILAPLAATGLLLSATAGFAQMTPGSDPSAPSTMPGTPGSTPPGTPGSTTPVPGTPTPPPTDPSTMPPTAPADPTAGAGIPDNTTTMGNSMSPDHDQHRTDRKKKRDRVEQPN